MKTNNEMATRGIEAQQVLDNPAFLESMALLRQSALRELDRVDIRDSEGQRLLIQFMRSADRFEQILTGLVRTGQFAERKIIDDKNRNETPLRRDLRRIFSKG